MNNDKELTHLEGNRIDVLSDRIAKLMAEAQNRVATAVNTAMVYSYYEIGRYIVEDEQEGEYRAKYGKQVLVELSARLTEKLGKGWSAEHLRLIRNFYLVYSSPKIQNTVLEIQTNSVNSVYEIQTNPKIQNSGLEIQTENGNQWLPNFTLPWSHYLVLMRVDNPEARSFYEIEAQKQQWSVRQLQRQIGSSLYERLALSRNKDEIMRLAREGQTIEKPSDIIKDPLVLDFMGLKPDASYTETTIESAIIDKLQQFLMEMGKGFLFEARQKRFTFEERHFFVDLVLYNRLLQCYVLVDLKMDDLTHQDLGQMQMYVNYYDRYVKQDFEKPTIGILLCERKNEALVELTLPKDAKIYAQQYALYLPDKTLLQQKLQLWIAEKNEEDKF